MHFDTKTSARAGPAAPAPHLHTNHRSLLSTRCCHSRWGTCATRGPRESRYTATGGVYGALTRAGGVNNFQVGGTAAADGGSYLDEIPGLLFGGSGHGVLSAIGDS